MSRAARADVHWVVESTNDDSVFRWGRADGWYVAEWGAGLVTAWVDSDGTVLSITGAEGTTPAQIERMRRGAIAAFARAVVGHPSLHASAVAFDERAIVMVGPSGAGKSTLAAELCRREGVRLLADDVAGLERAAGTWHALPSEPFHWLIDGENQGSKRSIAPRIVADRPAVIGAIVCLDFDEALEEPRLRDLRGAGALGVLIEAVLRFDRGAPVWVREFELIGELTEQAKIYRLSRPRTSRSLRDSADRVEELFHGT
jgi:HPr kinase/phosphorylase